MKFLFITGTRADYGKLKPLLKQVAIHPKYEALVLATGMHLHKQYGYTYLEIVKDNLAEIETCITGNQNTNVVEAMAVLMKAILYTVQERCIDAIIVHGDRPEALSGALVGALNNTKVIHVEGGEVSGTIDDSIRHAVTKLSHYHLCNSETAFNRLIQLGESRNNIATIGSPDLDILLSAELLPDWHDVVSRYDIAFKSKDFYLVMLHPVTTEFNQTERNARYFFQQISEFRDGNFIVVLPNNDLGSDIIVKVIEEFCNNTNIQVYKSFRFEYFLSILKNSKGLLGNSSAGLHEAPAIGLPVLNYGTRQSGRFNHECILNIDYDDFPKIGEWLKLHERATSYKKSEHYGSGSSSTLFKELLDNKIFHNIDIQKSFTEI